MMSEMRSRIEALVEQLTAEGYAGYQERARHIVDGCRATLTRGTGQLGPWEAQQLDVAERAIGANFLRLGLVSAQTALAVSQLPREKYEYGLLNEGRRTLD